jgi:hypothetical protein
LTLETAKINIGSITKAQYAGESTRNAAKAALNSPNALRDISRAKIVFTAKLPKANSPWSAIALKE